MTVLLEFRTTSDHFKSVLHYTKHMVLAYRVKFLNTINSQTVFTYQFIDQFTGMDNLFAILLSRFRCLYNVIKNIYNFFTIGSRIWFPKDIHVETLLVIKNK
jgi:hypothetical protein